MCTKIDGSAGHAWYKFLDKHVYPGEGNCCSSLLVQQLISRGGALAPLRCVHPACVTPNHPADAPTSNKAVLIKTALDQLVWGPGMTLVFFAFLKTLEGRPDLILHTVGRLRQTAGCTEQGQTTGCTEQGLA